MNLTELLRWANLLAVILTPFVLLFLGNHRSKRDKIQDEIRENTKNVHERLSSLEMTATLHNTWLVWIASKLDLPIPIANKDIGRHFIGKDDNE